VSRFLDGRHKRARRVQSADTSLVERRVFRIMFWQKVTPLLALPVFAFMFWLAPFNDGWSGNTWIATGALVLAAAVLYLWAQWCNSAVILDEDGLTYHGRAGSETWPYEKLIKVKEVGRFRARMCYDPDIPDKHWHISFDLFDRDGFVDALLDWYEHTTGHELPEDDTHEQAAA
jgi:hypothetical protein